ncbi:hypothetical protein LZC95_20180 [Pendulispora brunnea]|uniref:PEGA domain-containing protein n=1 Tax=Pendulispora brunnea TaxID=2905690 RepID=A0ABZ2KN71_9BACT
MAGVVQGLVVPGAALAQPQPSKAQLQNARTLFAEGAAREDAQDWATALERFLRAGTIKMTPGIKFHIAYCEEHLGRLVEALADYTEAQEQARLENNREVNQSSSDAIAALRPRVPSLRILVPDARDVEVLVDAQPLAPSDGGYATWVNPGTHDVLVQATGTLPYRASRTLAEREAATIEVKFEWAPKAARAAATPSPATPPPAAPSAPAAKPFWTPGHTIAISLFGAGLLAAGGGAYFALKGISNGDEADRLRAQLGTPSEACAQPANPQVASTCQQLNDTIDTHRTQYNLQRGFYIAAAGLVATSVAVWFLWPEPKSKTKSLGIRVTPAIDIPSRSVSLQGTF